MHGGNGNRGSGGCSDGDGGQHKQGQATINNKRQHCGKDGSHGGGGNRAAVVAAVATSVAAARYMMIGHWVNL